MFALPRIIQTDHGKRFVSSLYHPESQGALERWHQTPKSMLQKYSLESGRSLEEGVPFLLFAARDAVQVSFGFSPAEHAFEQPSQVFARDVP